MIESFNVHIFYPDGRAPESSAVAVRTMSKKWLGVCRDLLDQHGPVLNQNLGSTLSHFSVRLAGPMGQLSAYGEVQFDLALCARDDTEQGRASADWFLRLLSGAAEVWGSPVSSEAERVVRASATAESLLLLDRCTPDLEENQKLALLQFGTHLGGAYFIGDRHAG